MERERVSAKVKKKNEVCLGTILAHYKPLAPPMKLTTVLSWVGRRDTLDALHSSAFESRRGVRKRQRYADFDICRVTTAATAVALRTAQCPSLTVRIHTHPRQRAKEFAE
jgi:hypothetical protein